MKKQPHQPIPVLYGLLRGVGGGLLRLFFGYRRVGPSVPREGPLLVVAAHQGMLDFLTVADVLPGRVVRFLATRRFFRLAKLRPFLRLDGAIPKTQFYPDPACIMEVLRTLRGGGTVGMFPAGQTSVCGLPETVMPGIARLVRRANVPVCAVRQHGGFYSLPRFRPSHPAFGRLEAEARVILTPERMEGMTDAEIYRAICDGIAFDEAAWQARTGARFRGKHRAAGLEGALWWCPRCGAELALRGEGNAVRCRACGAEAALGADMRFAPPFPETVTAWYLLQERRLRAAVAESGWTLETAAGVEYWDGERFIPHGHGLLRLDRERLWFERAEGGAGDAEPLSVRCGMLGGLTVAGNRLIEVFVEGTGPVRFAPDDPAAVAKWKQAQELLYRMEHGLDCGEPCPACFR